MGKWDKIIKGLPPKPPEDPNYQRRVDMRANEYKEQGVTAPEVVVAEYYRWRREKAQLEEKRSLINLNIAALEQLIQSSYDDAGITNIKRDDGSSVGVQYEPHAGIIDRDAARRWAIENGHERELQLAWSTLNSLTKDLLEAGQAPPDGVAVYVRPKVVLRGAKDVVDAFSGESLPV